MPQKYFHVDGTATFVVHAGPTTLPGHPPRLDRGHAVVCLHGRGGNTGFFAPLIERLAERHSPVAFDQPAHGRSGGLDSLPSVESRVAFTAGVCAALGIERAVVVAHSLGTAVAVQLALDHPALVRALVLIGGGARVEIGDDELEQLRLVTEGKARRPFDRSIFASSASPDVLRAGFTESFKTDPRATYGDALALRGFDAEARLGELAIPTLVVHGEEELAPIAECAARLAGSVTGATHVVVPKAGHMLPLEQPDALADAILPFLDGVAA